MEAWTVEAWTGGGLDRGGRTGRVPHRRSKSGSRIRGGGLRWTPRAAVDVSPDGVPGSVPGRSQGRSQGRSGSRPSLRHMRYPSTRSERHAESGGGGDFTGPVGEPSPQNNVAAGRRENCVADGTGFGALRNLWSVFPSPPSSGRRRALYQVKQDSTIGQLPPEHVIFSVTDNAVQIHPVD